MFRRIEPAGEGIRFVYEDREIVAGAGDSVATALLLATLFPATGDAIQDVGSVLQRVDIVAEALEVIVGHGRSSGAIRMYSMTQ